MQIQNTALAFAEGFQKALADEDSLARAVAGLQESPGGTLVRLAGGTERAEDMVQSQPQQSVRFLAAILVASLQRAGETLASVRDEVRPTLHTALAFGLAAQSAQWLDHEVDEQKLSGTPQEVFAALSLCFHLSTSVDEKNVAVGVALMQLAACEAEQLVDPTRDCGPERSNLNAAVNAAEAALFNFLRQCLGVV